MSPTDPQTVATPTLMSLLKAGTLDLHRKIEASLPLMKPHFTFGQYRDYLLRTYSLYLPFEKAFEDVEPFFFEKLELNRRQKVQWLLADLHEMGFSHSDLAAKDACDIWPVFASPFEFLGALYVIEGSTLGGKIIQRHLQSHLGLRPNQLRFFEAYGDQTGPMWMSFRTAAEELTVASDHPSLLRGAISTFDIMSRWL